MCECCLLSVNNEAEGDGWMNKYTGYSGGHVSTVGYVLVTNLKTGFRKGALDKAEVNLQSFCSRF